MRRVAEMNATKTRESASETRRAHCNRLKKLIDWWMVEFPDYFEVGTRVFVCGGEG